jgi:hypothetical protein
MVRRIAGIANHFTRQRVLITAKGSIGHPIRVC